jgi:hypothetical protein
LGRRTLPPAPHDRRLNGTGPRRDRRKWDPRGPVATLTPPSRARSLSDRSRTPGRAPRPRRRGTASQLFAVATKRGPARAPRAVALAPALRDAPRPAPRSPLPPLAPPQRRSAGEHVSALPQTCRFRPGVLTGTRFPGVQCNRHRRLGSYDRSAVGIYVRRSVALARRGCFDGTRQREEVPRRVFAEAALTAARAERPRH